MIGRGGETGTWRNSYDVEDSRAQVATVHWDQSPNNSNALKFFDAFANAVVRYSLHIRQAGKQLPISMNAKAVLQALLSVMDGKTARCDPSLDEIARRSRLSRRTVVRQLFKLRAARIIDWVRRTVKTGHAKGEGPQRQQTSNAYFIDLLNVPSEIVRTLRQKLGAKLREKVRHLRGSGPVPNRATIKGERLVATAAGALSVNTEREQAKRRALAGGSEEDRLVAMYGGDLEAIRQHKEMLNMATRPSASAKLALYPSLRTIREVA